MPPLPQNQLLPRRSTPHNDYAIIFGVLGSVIVIGCIIWGYCLPKWRKKHRRPVQTRYNCIRRAPNRGIEPEDDLELPVIFPPHPAVAVPFNKKRGSTAPHSVRDPQTIPVYDPRTLSPFLNTPRSASCRPLTMDVSMRHETLSSARKPVKLHTARLQQRNHACGSALPDVPGTWRRQEKFNNEEHSGRPSSRHLLLVARPAGAPPAKSKLARPTLEISRYPALIQKGHASFIASTPSASDAADELTSAGHDQRHQLSSEIYSKAGKTGNSTIEQERSKGMCKPVCTVDQAGLGVHNLLQTPSSPATATTRRFGSSASRGNDSTLPTPSGSSAVQPRGCSGIYPGTSNLVPSRRFKDYLPTWRSRETTWADVGAQADPCFSFEGTIDSIHIPRSSLRSVSAPPSSSRQAATVGRDLDALSEHDSITDIQLPRTVSPHSTSSSTDSSTLFPRPLAFHRTITSQSPILSPTPLGRHAQNATSNANSLHRKVADLQPIPRRKSPGSIRHPRMSTDSCCSHEKSSLPQKNANSAYQSLEANPFIDQLGLARLGGNKRRSSMASLSTLKIPKSFRPSIARGTSSIYSRHEESTSMLRSPGFPSEFSQSLQSLPKPKPRRAMSFDETIFKDPDWKMSRDDDANARHEAFTALHPTRESSVGSGAVPQTPTLPDHGQRPMAGTPQVGTVSSHTFGAKMPVPKISIARSSDDVFGTNPNMAENKRSETRAGAQRTNEMAVLEDGNVFKRVGAMESKLSREDLVRYGGKTAPGGVEWF